MFTSHTKRKSFFFSEGLGCQISFSISYFLPYSECSLTIPALCPSQPNPPKVGMRAKNNLTLRWNAPPDNGASISQYELEWDQCRGEWEQIYCDKAKQYKHNHHFTPGSHAQFRLRACNEIGWR